MRCAGSMKQGAGGRRIKEGAVSRLKGQAGRLKRPEDRRVMGQEGVGSARGRGSEMIPEEEGVDKVQTADEHKEDDWSWQQERGANADSQGD